MNVLYNPLLPQVIENPYPTYDRLRRLSPVYFHPLASCWFLTRHEDCLCVLRDARLSARFDHGKASEFTLPRSMLNTDPPDHTRLRRAAASVFSSDGATLVREYVREWVGRLLADRLSGETLDVIGDLAIPVSVAAIARIIGIPESDLPLFRYLAISAAPVLDPLSSVERAKSGYRTAQALRDYISDLLDERRGVRRHDLMSVLETALDGPDSITRDEILTTCNLIVIGGCAPTAHVIGNGVYALLKHPEQLDRLRRQPTCIGLAISEMLRFDPPIQQIGRVALEEISIGETAIRRGDLVVCLLGAANRDPSAFQGPEVFDVMREPNPHLAFGSGIHACLGSFVTRIVAEETISQLITRFPYLNLESGCDPAWSPFATPRGLLELSIVLQTTR